MCETRLLQTAKIFCGAWTEKAQDSRSKFILDRSAIVQSEIKVSSSCSCSFFLFCYFSDCLQPLQIPDSWRHIKIFWIWIWTKLYLRFAVRLLIKSFVVAHVEGHLTHLAFETLLVPCLKKEEKRLKQQGKEVKLNGSRDGKM